MHNTNHSPYLYGMKVYKKTYLKKDGALILDIKCAYN